MKSFAIYDMKAQGTFQSFNSINAQTAMREISEHIMSGKIPPSYASDYALYETGENDDITMRVIGLENPKHIIDLRDLLKEIEQNVESN